jgi:molybdenum cofactor biosynthesis enzyme MoaA
MPLGDATRQQSEMVTADEIRSVLLAAGSLTHVKQAAKGSGPAGYYEWLPGNPEIPPLARRALETITGRRVDSLPLPATGAKIGFIASVSEHFCAGCNRLRLTSDGKLNPCLWSAAEIDIREKLRSGASLDEISRTILDAANAKPEAHGLAGAEQKKRRMSRLGG